jgi:cell division protein FtsN
MDIIKIYIIIFLSCCFLAACSSGEYDLEKTTVQETQKQIVRDTIKPLADEEIKEEIRPSNESYSYIIQIGAYFIESNYRAFFERSKSVLGNDVYYTFTNSLYKIRIGSYDNRNDALNFLDHVKSLGFDDAFIITVRK